MTLCPSCRLPRVTYAARAQLDMNGNGYLSLAELDKGMRDVLKINAIFSAKPVMLRAFNAAKGAAQTKSRLGPDYVEKGKEFRLLLHYLRQYFELYAMFNRVDTDDDMRVELHEFEKAVPLLHRWGIDVKDPAKRFKEIDTDGGGMVLFDEFSRWALEKGLDLDDDDDAPEPPLPAVFAKMPKQVCGRVANAARADPAARTARSAFTLPLTPLTALNVSGAREDEGAKAEARGVARGDAQGGDEARRRRAPRIRAVRRQPLRRGHRLGGDHSQAAERRHAGGEGGAQEAVGGDGHERERVLLAR